MSVHFLRLLCGFLCVLHLKASKKRTLIDRTNSLIFPKLQEAKIRITESWYKVNPEIMRQNITFKNSDSNESVALNAIIEYLVDLKQFRVNY